jgi:hypothetical protein
VLVESSVNQQGRKQTIQQSVACTCQLLLLLPGGS